MEKTILRILGSRTFSHSLGHERRFGDIGEESGLPQLRTYRGVAAIRRSGLRAFSHSLGQKLMFRPPNWHVRYTSDCYT
jgi:hypothetical protein